MSPAATSLALRLVVVAPPPDVMFCIQGKPGERFDEVRSKGADLTFDFTVNHAGELPDGAPRFLGKVVQGPPAARFVYLCSGTLAGDPESCWTRRAKIPLAGIPLELCRSGRRLEARIDGRARDGGPACATVPLLGKGWRPIR